MKLIVVLLLSVCTVASAAVALGTGRTKEGKTDFVREVEEATRANLKAIGGGTEAIRKHHGWYVELENKRKAFFVDVHPCSIATQSARALWVAVLQYDMGPNDFSYNLLADRQQDYRQKMKACWQRVGV